MSTLTLEIPIPKGYEIKSFDAETGKVLVQEKPKPITERIKTIEDVLKANDTSQEAIDKMFVNAPAHLKSQYIAELLCKTLNEDWTPDWDDSDQYKYYPWFVMSASGFRFDDCDYWRAYSNCGSRLCLKSRKLAEYAGKQFTALFKEFMIIN